ncbi:hypothetical protein AB3X52_04580 [Nocardioides sp. DS6]|uniref:ClpX-type ZB domain-containing protein n=1 Tax=Nocardioides eburneus TaxID=3231482 RepID=A0ABV3SXY3_9ACTN
MTPRDAARAAYARFTPTPNSPEGNDPDLWPLGWDRMPADGAEDTFWIMRVPVELLPYYCRCEAVDANRLRQARQRREKAPDRVPVLAQPIADLMGAGGRPVPLLTFSRDRGGDTDRMLHLLAVADAWGTWQQARAAAERVRQGRYCRCQMCARVDQLGVFIRTLPDGRTPRLCQPCYDVAREVAAELAAEAAANTKLATGATRAQAARQLLGA